MMGGSLTQLSLPLLPVKGALGEENAAPTEERMKREKLEQYRLVCSEILPHVYVSGEDVARSAELLRRHGITHVVNCAGPSMDNLFPEQFSYLKLQLHDSKEEDLSWFVYEVVGFIEDARRRNPQSRVLLHCLQGVSRSVSFAIAYVMWSANIDFTKAFNRVSEWRRRGLLPPSCGKPWLMDGAPRLGPCLLRQVKRCRPIASPNTGFICNLLEWQQYRANEVGTPCLCHGDQSNHASHPSPPCATRDM
jgi:protein-tyrosine phosphatase